MIGNPRFYTEITARRKIKEVGDKHKITRKTAMQKITGTDGTERISTTIPASTTTSRSMQEGNTLWRNWG